MTIQAVEAFPLRLPREGAPGLAGSPTTLAGQGAYRWSTAYPALYSIHSETTLVRVTTDTGLVGWGEAQAPLAPQVAAVIIGVLLAPVLAGELFDGSPAAIERCWWRMYSTMRVRGQTGGFMLDAISGIDLALWDLAGQMAGQTVAGILNANYRARVPVYLSGLVGNTPAERVAFAASYYEQGIRHFKLYYDTEWNDLLATFDALRQTFGPEVGIAVDGLWHLDAAQAKDLDDRHALWLECPLLPEDVAAHGALAQTIRTPLALGESYRTVFEFAPFFAAGAIRYAQPDLGRSGLTESRRIAALAAEHGASVVPHLSVALGPQIAAALHLAAALPNCPLCEYNPRIFALANRFLNEPLQMEDGHYVVPPRPGLGLTLRIEELLSFQLPNTLS